MEHLATLRTQVDLAAGRALGEQDASPYSPTAGCFDRRYWAWKIVDFPEATFQRLVYPLAVLYRDPHSRFHGQPEVLAAIRAGLRCAARLQHANGSFDQAFPFEQSYGATAFLLSPLLEAARLVDDFLSDEERREVERVATSAAGFLCAHGERHGVISNHLAGAAWSLTVAADRFRDRRYENAAATLVEFVLGRQSSEGWFPEYDGADPGYQTLCLEYLTAIAERRPAERLSQALNRSIDFLKWFVHPDGTFGGIYGSRRTSLVYLSGFARMARTNATAAAMCEALAASMASGGTPGPAVMDSGNLAPMLTTTALALPLLASTSGQGQRLPWQWPEARADFGAAGLHVRSSHRYYAICGLANGGTVTVFDRDAGRLLLDDGGYVAATGATRLTTQTRTASVSVGDRSITVDVPFVKMPVAVPTPGQFVLLRILNLTIMRSIAAGNWMKRRMVAMLMSSGGASSLRLARTISFEPDHVTIHDRISNPGGLRLDWIRGGQPFSAIHMASAGYFHGARLGTARAASEVDIRRLDSDHDIELNTRV